MVLGIVDFSGDFNTNIRSMNRLLPPRSEGAVRAYRASRFLRRSLLREGFASAAQPDGVPPTAAEVDWLQDVAREPWTVERMAQGLRSAIAPPAFPADFAAVSSAITLPTPPDGGDAVAAVALGLRRLRRRMLCGLLVRDVAGVAPLEEVMQTMTTFAEFAVRTAMAAILPDLARRMPVPSTAQGRPQDLFVIGMGKAGAWELNVSSDLDLVFVYGDESPAAQEFFDRAGRRLIAVLADAGEDGFVFRTDLRLRPHGDSGPLTVSLAMLEEYLQRDGREWERFAWSKARVLSAPVLMTEADFQAQQAALDAVVTPFVYRRYFDFGAIGAIRDLHVRIRAQARNQRGRAGRGEAAGGEIDLKLGRGGIREIEFIAQAWGIMRGGRDARLRQRATLPMLATLAASGRLPQAEADALADAYRFLRRLEHAVQYRDDAQTHRFPADPAERDAVAQLFGAVSASELQARLSTVRAGVERMFDAMFPPAAVDRMMPAAAAVADVAAVAAESCDSAADRAGNKDQANQADQADPANQADPADPADHLPPAMLRFLASPRVAVLPEALRRRLGVLAATAAREIGEIERETREDRGCDGPSGSAEVIAARWVRLMEVIGRRTTYFALLAEYPRAHARVLRVLTVGGWAAEYLLRHPILLDELIDPRAEEFAAEVDVASYWAGWARELDASLRAAGTDVEAQMNRLRDAHHAAVFRLVLSDLAGHLTVERVADHLSAAADAVLQIALDAAWRSMVLEPGSLPPLPRLAVVAYGKLGGRELGYASDLDLIFVVDDTSGHDELPGDGLPGDPSTRDRAATGGPMPGAPDLVRCAQLVRRFLSWLTSVTSSGNLFEIDLRLRPNGSAGVLVTPLSAFEDYQINADGHGAWFWEHQALTRARPCAGDAGVGLRVEAIRRSVLRRERDPEQVRAEVVAMRRRMLDEHTHRNPDGQPGKRFDCKHDRGGMIDIEFAVQALVLRHAPRHPELLDNRGNIGLLGIAAALGLLDAAVAQAAVDAYRRYRRLQHALRLAGAADARVDRDRVQGEIEAVLRLWRAVLETEVPELAASMSAGLDADPLHGKMSLSRPEEGAVSLPPSEQEPPSPLPLAGEG